MKTNLYAFIVVMALVASSSTLAEGPGWTVASNVIRIVSTVNGGFNVKLNPGLQNCISQSGFGATYASVYPSHPGIKLMKADLLLAYATGRPVQLFFTDNTCKVGEMSLGGTYDTVD